MTATDLAWLLVLLAGFDLTILVRRGLRWHGIQVAQSLLVALAGVGALATSRPQLFLTLGIAWYLLTRLVPAGCLWLSQVYQQRGSWRRTAKWRNRAGWFLGGQYRRWYGGLADSMLAIARGKREEATEILQAIGADNIPPQIRGQVDLLTLGFFLQRRQWTEAIEWFEQVRQWATVGIHAEAHLMVARAYAECGRFELALHCVETALLSPLAGRFRQLTWMTRIRLAAMAGHPAEVKRLLARRSSRLVGQRRFGVYWRGRCALACGDYVPAAKLLARAYALTDPRDSGWREAIRHYLELAEHKPALTDRPAAETDGYAAGFKALQEADRTSAVWRNLLVFDGREPVTLVLAAGLGLAWCLGVLAGPAVRIGWETRFGNVPWSALAGEWWRPLTALFFHDGLVHVLSNCLGLALLGGVIARVMGWWRVLVLFLVGGYGANLFSGWFGRFDLAIGASSGVYALFGAYAVLVYSVHHRRYATLRRWVLALLGLVLVIDLLVGIQAYRVDYMAHLGGVLSGIGIGAGLWLTRQKLGPLPNADYSHPA